MRTIAEWVAERWFDKGVIVVVCGLLLTLISWITPETRKEIKDFWQFMWQHLKVPQLQELNAKRQKERANQ